MASWSEASREFLVWLRASAQAEAFPTGYSTLDSATGGFMRGAVAVTAGLAWGRQDGLRH
ncbi:MAG: hypothetical protein ACLTOU_07205 [Acutalibacter sp.]